jgi:GrpB-like predicted nucleotidyltransferase (UPF0157 family)
MRKVEVVPPNSGWQEDFRVESQQVVAALGKNIVTIYHIGSTAIPGIYAKPIIDILVEVKNLAELDRKSLLIALLGYEVMGEFGISSRRFFRKDNSAGLRTHHIHAFPTGSAQLERHLAFRDYLSTHPMEAQQYSDLKRALAKQHPTNIEGYMDGKDEFIKAIDWKAAQWRIKELDLDPRTNPCTSKRSAFSRCSGGDDRPILNR